MYKAKDCSRFDYGSAEANTKHYGTPIPPAYNLTSFTNTPVFLFWAQNDWLADPKVSLRYYLTIINELYRFFRSILVVCVILKEWNLIG